MLPRAASNAVPRLAWSAKAVVAASGAAALSGGWIVVGINPGGNRVVGADRGGDRGLFDLPTERAAQASASAPIHTPLRHTGGLELPHRWFVLGSARIGTLLSARASPQAPPPPPPNPPYTNPKRCARTRTGSSLCCPSGSTWPQKSKRRRANTAHRNLRPPRCRDRGVCEGQSCVGLPCCRPELQVFGEGKQRTQEAHSPGSRLRAGTARGKFGLGAV